MMGGVGLDLEQCLNRAGTAITDTNKGIVLGGVWKPDGLGPPHSAPRPRLNVCSSSSFSSTTLLWSEGTRAERVCTHM